MHISPINQIAPVKLQPLKRQNVSFSASAPKINAPANAVKAGVLASVIAFFKGIKEFFAGDDWTDDNMPQSDMDVDMEIKTARDMIP